MSSDKEFKPGNGNSRRRFIQGLGAVAVASNFAGMASAQARKSGGAPRGTSYGPPPGSLEEGGGWNANALPQPGPLSKEPMPTVKFGKYQISRLILGCNAPGSHFSWREVAASQKWLTPERIQLQNKRMQELGINCLEGGGRRLSKEDEGKVLYTTRGTAKAEELRNTANWRAPQASGAISIIHDSVGTDSLFRAGKLNLVREYVKIAKDTGMLVGVSSHIPEVFETIESQGGWDLDYYMCALYRFGRTHDEWIKEFPTNPHMLPVEIGHPYEQYMPAAIYGGEVAFVKGDPPKMFKVVQQTKKPCFIFKVMACGHLCQSPATTELNLKYVLSNIKASDIMVIGMGDQYLDEFAFNKECVVKYSKLSLPVA
jgi:hypothetical protein